MRTNSELIKTVSEFLGKPLRAKTLEEDIATASGLQSQVLEARAHYQCELADKKLQYLHPKDKSLTDMDRKIMLEGSINAVQEDYELFAGYEKILEQRIASSCLLLQLYQSEQSTHLTF